MNRFLILLALIALVVITGRGSMASPAGSQNVSKLRPPVPHPTLQTLQTPPGTTPPPSPSTENSQWASDYADRSTEPFSVPGKRLRDGSLLP